MKTVVGMGGEMVLFDSIARSALSAYVRGLSDSTSIERQVQTAAELLKKDVNYTSILKSENILQQNFFSNIRLTNHGRLTLVLFYHHMQSYIASIHQIAAFSALQTNQYPQWTTSQPSNQ